MRKRVKCKVSAMAWAFRVLPAAVAEAGTPVLVGVVDAKVGTGPFAVLRVDSPGLVPP